MDEFYTVKEVAEKLKISLPTMYRYIKKCVITAVKLEQDWLIPKKELEKYLESKVNKGEKKNDV